MSLLLLHPEVAKRSCEDCQRWVYDDRPGCFAAEPMTIRGHKIVRPPIGKLACSYCPKQPESVPVEQRSPQTAVVLSKKNELAYLHYLECKAVGEFPDDGIVRRNATIIRSVEDAVERMDRLRFAASLARRGGA